MFAYDRETGAPLWASEPLETESSLKAHLAYDRGLLIAADDEGNVMALSAETGKTVWAVSLDPIDGLATMPVAADGVVFITGATVDELGGLFALDERNGSVIYRAMAQGIGHVTLGGSRLFTSGGCHETQASDRANGHPLWHYEEECFGGGNERTVFDDGRLFVNDGRSIVGLEAVSGMLRSSIDNNSGLWPLTVAGGEALLALLRARGGELGAFDLDSGEQTWSVRLDETPVLPLLITPGYAFVVTRAPFQATHLQAIDLAEHRLAWTSAEPAAEYDPGYVSSGSGPFQGLAAAQGCIVMAFERTLTAFAQ